MQLPVVPLLLWKWWCMWWWWWCISSLSSFSPFRLDYWLTSSSLSCPDPLSLSLSWCLFSSLMLLVWLVSLALNSYITSKKSLCLCSCLMILLFGKWGTRSLDYEWERDEVRQEEYHAEEPANTVTTSCCCSSHNNDISSSADAMPLTACRELQQRNPDAKRK